MAHWAEVADKHQMLLDFMEWLAASGVTLNFDKANPHPLDDEKPDRIADLYLRVDRAGLEAERRSALEAVQKNVEAAVKALPPQPLAEEPQRVFRGDSVAIAAAHAMDHLLQQRQRPDDFMYAHSRAPFERSIPPDQLAAILSGNSPRDLIGELQTQASQRLGAENTEVAWGEVMREMSRDIDWDTQIACMHVVEACKVNLCLECGNLQLNKLRDRYSCGVCGFEMTYQLAQLAVSYGIDARQRVMNLYKGWLALQPPSVTTPPEV